MVMGSKYAWQPTHPYAHRALQLPTHNYLPKQCAFDPLHSVGHAALADLHLLLVPTADKICPAWSFARWVVSCMRLPFQIACGSFLPRPGEDDLMWPELPHEESDQAHLISNGSIKTVKVSWDSGVQSGEGDHGC